MPDAAPVTMIACWDGIFHLAGPPTLFDNTPGTLGQVPIAGNASTAWDISPPMELAVVAAVLISGSPTKMLVLPWAVMPPAHAIPPGQGLPVGRLVSAFRRMPVTSDGGLTSSACDDPALA